MANIEALMELRRVCEAVPDDLLHMRMVTEETGCGTAHCLIGWASLDPWFLSRARFYMERLPFGYWDTIEVQIAELLDISPENAHRLFASGIGRDADPHGVTKQEVLWNIDRLIAGKDARMYRTVKSDRRWSIRSFTTKSCVPQLVG